MSWVDLANSDDYMIVIKALIRLASFVSKRGGTYYIEKKSYSQISSPLGKEILDFLQLLKNFDEKNLNNKWSNWSYLDDEVEIMTCVFCFHKDYGWYPPNLKVKNELYSMSKRGSQLANYAFKATTTCVNRGNQSVYWDVAKYAVKQIADKLNDRRL